MPRGQMPMTADVESGQLMNKPNVWSRVFLIAGSIAMVIGAIDPLEGSVIILPGSALFALGTFLDPGERRFAAYRLVVLILIAFGIVALWGLSSVGGFGGSSGLSNWWGLLILPYPIGWSMGIWGPGSPRWLCWLGIGIGLWYLAILAMILRNSGLQDGTIPVAPGILVAAVGVLTIGGCIYRLSKQVSA